MRKFLCAFLGLIMVLSLQGCFSRSTHTERVIDRDADANTTVVSPGTSTVTTTR